MKCKNCGAELNNGKCEYCGSIYAENMLYMDFKIDPDVVTRFIKKSPLIIKGDCNKDNDSVMHKVEVMGGMK